MTDGESILARGWRFPFPRLGKLWRAPLGWLRNVPIVDPVDRRNAPMLQLISLLLAVLPALAWLYRIFAVDIPWRPGELASMAMSLSVCAVAAAGFALIRFGRFAWASRLLLVVFAVTVIPAYLATGFGAQRFEQPVLVIWMAVAGLVVGRVALWIMFATVVAAFFAGTAVDVVRQGNPGALYGDAAFSTAMFLMIAIVMDRSSAALRESLREANARGDQLAAANQRLTQEIADREKAREQLIHAQKVEAVGRLASGVAHDFGNLVSVIDGYVRKGMRSDDKEQVKQSLSGIEAAARRATLLTHKLLTFSRQEENTGERIDAAAVLVEMQPMLRQLFNPDVRIHYHLADFLPEICLDRTQFELMILNIAANADHAMPRGGTFTVDARADDEDRLALRLSDTGAGMSPAVRERMFDPFFTTKPAGQGTGLGLSVVRDMVERAGGSITAESAEGTGTTLCILLPTDAG